MVDHANPQPTCIIGRATATGLGVQVSLFAKGVLYKTRKTIWSKKAMKLVDTYRKLCGRDIGTGSLPSPATQTDPQSGSGQPPALPAFAADGRYAMDTCPSGFRDCDARPDTGCTDILFDNQNCGECGQQVPGGMMCYKGYMVRVPLNPAVVVAKYGGYSPIEARVLPASGDLKDIS